MARSSTAELWLKSFGEIAADRGGFFSYRPSGKLDKQGKKQFERVWVSGGGLGRGIGEGGKYRPQDDPHPSTWIVAQMGWVYAGLSPDQQDFLWKHYVEGVPTYKLDQEFGSRQRARTIQRKILEAVERRVVGMKEQTIAEAHAKQLAETVNGPAWQEVIQYLLSRSGIRRTAEGWDAAA